MESLSSPVESEECASTQLFCRMCQAVYKQPKLLPCLHSFCRPCLVGAVSHGSEGTIIVCPVCSHKAKLPPSGVVGVPDNSFLNRMCQEYLTEVQSHLVARSHPTAVDSGLQDVTARQSTRGSRSLVSDLSLRREPQRDVEENSHPDEDSNFAPGSGQPTADALEAIRNMSKIQTKIMSLQGEALRVTYAIDQVNQSAFEWHQHKEDIKRAIERRSGQFQFFIKRMEHQFLTQVDSKNADDIFYAESDKSKRDLRMNLKNILFEVSVLKSVQEQGKDSEINALSSLLLGKSVGMSDVVMTKQRFDLDTPEKSIEEIVNMYFGEILHKSETVNVFTPEIINFNEITPESAPVSLDTSNPTVMVAGRETPPVTEYKEFERETDIKKTNRRSDDRRSRKYKTDLGLDKDDVKEYLAQFQSARETLRCRRQEILARGQIAREDTSPIRDEFQRRARSTSRQGRVQSLDRVALSMDARGRPLLPGRSRARESKPSETVRINQISDVDIIRSPETGTVSSSSNLLKKLVKQTSDPPYIYDFVDHEEKAAKPEVTVLDIPKSVVEPDRGRRFSSPFCSVSMGRRHSDQFSPLSPGERSILEVIKQDHASSRPVRRAISSAADRRAKIEFLRENWQKRKEILIQNEGFVSSEHAAKSATPLHTSTEAAEQATTLLNLSETKDQSETSPSDPRNENMHQIRNRIAQYRNELSKIGEARRKEATSFTTPSLDQKKDITGFTKESPRTHELYQGKEMTRFTTQSPRTFDFDQNEKVKSFTTQSTRTKNLDPEEEEEVTNVTIESVNTDFDQKEVTSYTTDSHRTKDVDQRNKETNDIKPPLRTEATDQGKEVTSFSRPPFKTEATDLPNEVTNFAKESSRTHDLYQRKEVTRFSTESSRNLELGQRKEKNSFSTQFITHDLDQGRSDFERQVNPLRPGEAPLTSEPSHAISQTISPTLTPASALEKERITQELTPSKNPLPALTTTTTTTAYLPTKTTISSPNAPTATTGSTTLSRFETSTARSSYSRYHTKPSETFDVASLIAAMYSGNEKAILHNSTPSSSTPIVSTVTVTTSATIITSINERKPENTLTTTATPRTLGTTTISSHLSLKETEKAQLSPTQTIQQENSESKDTDTPKMNESRRYRYAGSSRYRDSSDRRHTVEIGRAVVQEALKLMSDKETPKTRTSPSEPPKEATISLYNSYRSQIGDSSKKPEITAGTLTSDNKTSPSEFPKEAIISPYSSYRYKLGDSLKKLEITSGDNSDNKTSQSESPKEPITSPYSFYKNRLADSKKLGDNIGADLSEPTDADDIKDLTISYNIRASGVTMKVTSPLQAVQERKQPELTSPVLSPSERASSPLPSPTLLSPAEVAQKTKLREIARKKRERWRHLTIN